MSEEKSGFTVKDRRVFAEKDEDVKNKEAKDESSKQEAKDESSKQEAKDESSKQEAKDESSKQEAKDEFQTPLPEINFATFIFSLNASALLHLGVMEDPVTGKKVKNLSIGKQTIDILGMIEEKTKGNLSKEEENLLKNILYDLRIIYVKEQK
ncbi:MAG: DUF1844 domain-containing protein [Desulfobacteraceae bacterium]|nr:DUF1844 domain-containing protein [Desulfobacteraceae bacterium]MBC2719051.1 DUF1844 domain-containing protein [Desulfobacteraceae bacterium]